MQTVLDDFADRVAEVERYIKVLERLENPDVVLYDKSTRREKRVFEEGSLKVMKATVFLLIYNIVESAIRSAFGQLYEEIENEGMTGSTLSSDLRKIWIQQHFKSLDNDSSSIRTFRELTERIVEKIASGSTLKLDDRLMPVSGNLDSDTIRQVCNRHGVSTRVHRHASGGVELKTVKDQRNSLAHGNSSFSDCGQQYAVADLKRIMRQTVVFVRSILNNVKDYSDRKQYVG
jgi:hypothetical protein